MPTNSFIGSWQIWKEIFCLGTQPIKLSSGTLAYPPRFGQGLLKYQSIAALAFGGMERYSLFWHPSHKVIT